MSRTTNNLRVVDDREIVIDPAAGDETFDPEIDLGAIRPDDDIEESPQTATAPKRGGGLSGMLRTVLIGFGVLLILLVAMVMYLRGSRGPSTEPPVTASVPVLESALSGVGRVERGEVFEAAIEVEKEVASRPQEQSVEPHVTVPVAPADATPDAALPTDTITPNDTVKSVIAEMQQVLAEHRQLIQDQLEQNKQFQAELQAIRTSSEATSLRVDSVVADLAQVRHSLEDLTARETKKVATLQRQLAAKNEQARQQARHAEAQRSEPPPFRVASVTLWGSDYLATVTLLSGQQRDVTVGELLDGWKIDAISATGVSVTRLRDGAKLNLAAGV
ncbi:MAG TPA: hypothetical protein VFX11_18955 [Candidatus Kapabacteria bacterium]|nr:hypothetical protein [Candidatus Kapabacteria bacterium]